MDDNKKKNKGKRLQSESKLAYLLVSPAMLLILLIAIWPVIQSFYFSLFDLRLNDPAKSETHLSYNINLEHYLNNYPFLIGSLKNEINNAQSAEIQTVLNQVQAKLETLDLTLRQNEDIASRYNIVDEKLMNFQVVEPELKYVKVDKQTVQFYISQIEDTNNELKKISNSLNNEKKVIGLANALNDAIIKPNFIGLDHYIKNFSELRMWKAVGNTVFFTLTSVFTELVLGLIIALLINKSFKGRGIVRASILIPWAIPTAVSALMWKFLYDGQNGIIAKYFADLGLFEHMSDLLTTGTGAMFSVIFADVWKTTPYMALLLLAGLQTIPSSLYEAAAIDGANKWKQFTTITLPLLKSSILVALLFRTLDSFRVFDLIYVLTGGGPANSTETISVLAYKVLFGQTNFGEGSALSVIVFLFVALISIIYIKILGSDLLQEGSEK